MTARSSERLRVVFLSKAATLGGMEQVLAAIVERLDPSRFEATVLLRQGGPMLERYRAHAATHVFAEREAVDTRPIARRVGRLTARLGSNREQPGAAAPAATWARDIVIAFDPHVVVWHHNAPIRAFDSIATLGIPSLQQVTHHWSGISHYPDEWLRALASRTHHVCEGRTSVEHARFLLGVPEDRISVVRIGVDTASRDRQLADPRRVRRSDLGLPDDAIVVGTTGNIGLSKGADLWLRAAAELRDAHPEVALRFLWVGGSERQWSSFRGDVLRSIVRELDLDDIVVFAGERDDVFAHIDLCDIYVQPSRDDAFPGSTLEAMSLGKPVATFKIGIGAEEYAQEALLGIDAIDAHALAGAVSRLVVDAELRDRVGSAGRSLVDERFEIGASVVAFEQLLARVAGRTVADHA